MSRRPKPTKAQNEEAAFLERYNPNEFDRPSLAVDITLLTVRERQLEVLIIKRNEHPAKGLWSLPGGFVGITETLEAAANRVLKAKAHLEHPYLEQLFTFGKPNRDPRMRIISVAHYALVPPHQLQALEADDVRLAQVRFQNDQIKNDHLEICLENTPIQLAFDHLEMVQMTVQRLRGKLDYAPVGYALLPKKFTLRELQDVHETILGRSLNKDAFRRRMLETGELEATGERETGTGFRPAEFYKVKEMR
jgi:8-oxo-dGTP diphosphatase